MSYYKLYRSESEGKSVRGRLFRIEGKDQVEVCRTLENSEYLIPCLIYRLSVTESAKFGRLMVLVSGVPGRCGIRIHRGTKPEHSKGCILVSDIETERKLVNAILEEQEGGEEIRLEVN